MNQTFAGIVFNGEIRLRGNVGLPENTCVYVVVLDTAESSVAHIRTPRLAHPEQASEFKMEVLDDAQEPQYDRVPRYLGTAEQPGF